jgi:hypothetical protein
MKIADTGIGRRHTKGGGKQEQEGERTIKGDKGRRKADTLFKKKKDKGYPLKI